LINSKHNIGNIVRYAKVQ